MASTKAFAAFFIATTLLLAEPSLGIASKATFYNQYKHYSFAAAAPSIYSNGAACGRYYCVKCTSNGCRNSNVIRVKILDLCPGCPGAFDLSQQAFARIANPDAGVINIDYYQ
ncbi:putative EG45-like domain containing protein 1 [Selaginella moellendorffii]|uniref:putative EG45-like domain containing protein 1 n=1 Tax=Selaginella moellendorffii TaxID=88036 RepID=UPI000D1CCA93|nr:putative EG45-like domain containing protein 1 [Selaginella moellendorffii]|eukprot:XP_002979844.2 putative EG45-like domain containing protein 1 [Selaginella moellendorffii]